MSQSLTQHLDLPLHASSFLGLAQSSNVGKYCFEDYLSQYRTVQLRSYQNCRIQTLCFLSCIFTKFQLNFNSPGMPSQDTTGSLPVLSPVPVFTSDPFPIPPIFLIPLARSLSDFLSSFRICYLLIPFVLFPFIPVYPFLSNPYVPMRPIIM